MTIFDVAEALRRQQRFLRIGLGALLALTVLASFSFGDGGLGWRFGPRYQATVQIGVTDASVDSLTVSGAADPDFIASANLYAELVQSAEAAVFMGEENGYELGEPVVVKPSERAPTFSITVSGPSEEQAVGAATSAFEWLEQQLGTPLVGAEPLAEANVAPAIRLDGPFDSSIQVSIDASYGDLSEELFLLVDTGLNPLMAWRVDRTAGRVEQIRASLSPQMTVVASIEDARGRRGAEVRLAPPALPDVASEIPVLHILLRPGALAQLGVEDEDTSSWQVDPSLLEVDWGPGLPVEVESGSGRDVRVVLLTPDPVAVPIGERRGPLLMAAFLGVGAVLLLAVALTRDAWQQERGPVERSDDSGSSGIRRIGEALRRLVTSPDEEAASPPDAKSA